MSQQHEQRIFVPRDTALAPSEISLPSLGRTDNKSRSHEGSETLKAATPGCPRRPRSHVVKHAAKRTPRNRLIATLQRAHGTPESLKPDKSTLPELPETVPAAAVVSRPTNGDKPTALRVTVEIHSESPEPTAEPKAPGRNRSPAACSPKLKAGVLTQKQGSLLKPVSVESPDAEASKNTALRIKYFDSAAFDAAIYRQSGAMDAPQGVSVPRHRPQKPMSPSEDERMYIHADPAIHWCHNRSEEWHKQKSHEIQARGGRKAWFGEVIGRQRWLRAQEEARKRRINEEGSTHRRATPQPWTYRRPLDFGDVDESQLPEDVLDNPNWRKACAWHREVRQMKALRRRLALRSAHETQHFFRNLIAGIQPGPGRAPFLNHDDV